MSAGRCWLIFGGTVTVLAILVVSCYLDATQGKTAPAPPPECTIQVVELPPPCIDS